jgi:GNAT superfamily N-acetyltransferase
MKRREFLASSLAASAPSTLMAGGPATDQSRPEYYELRQYHLRRGPQVKLTDDFLREAALPAWKRLGIGPIGVFNTSIGPDTPTVYVLIPHPSLESVATTAARLQADPEYQGAGAAFFNVPSTDPSYVRMESALLIAFERFAKLELPPTAAENHPRIFELRTYESHSEKAHLKKVEMFNTGEIAIFRRTGLRPVFFGRTLIGSKLPNLTYMLTFDDMATRDKNWATFVADPEWKKLSTAPGYTDGEIVSNISNVLLAPAPYSQI